MRCVYFNFKNRSVVMTNQIHDCQRYQELLIVEGPPLHELLLSHMTCLSNHLYYGTCFGPRIGNRSVYFTTDTKWKAGGVRVIFDFITSISPQVSAGSTNYPQHKIGLTFSGCVSLGNRPTFLDGFYCPQDRTGYIIVPIHEH